MWPAVENEGLNPKLGFVWLLERRLLGLQHSSMNQRDTVSFAIMVITTAVEQAESEEESFRKSRRNLSSWSLVLWCFVLNPHRRSRDPNAMV